MQTNSCGLHKFAAAKAKYDIPWRVLASALHGTGLSRIAATLKKEDRS
jgi:hypothetical protein